MNAQSPALPWIRRHPVKAIILTLLALVITIIAIILILPFSVDIPESNPAQGFGDALARIQAIQKQEEEAGDVLPECRTTLMTHGDRAERVIVFMHGYTSCPEQFRQLGQEFFDKGYNVYIPRQPYHGLPEQIDNELRFLRAEDLAGYGTDSADIAQGLGDHVTVAGLSGGGSVAAWLAQYRSDVDIAIPIAPFLGIGFIPARLNRPLAKIIDLVPSGYYLWWDPVQKENNPLSAPYSYPRYSLKSLMEVLRLGFAAEDDIKQERPASPDIIAVYNAADESVNNAIIEEFIDLWQTHGAELLTTYIFDEALGLPHDLITPTRIGARVDIVYPVIHDLIENAGG